MPVHFRYMSIVALLCVTARLDAQALLPGTDTRDTSMVAPAAAPGDSAPVVLALVPTLERASVAVRMRTARSADALIPAPAPVPRRAQRGVGMMIFGGGALLVGSLVDGDSGRIIMVGGAVIGLLGLWDYLN